MTKGGTEKAIQSAEDAPVSAPDELRDSAQLATGAATHPNGGVGKA